jgi:secondary thiamine-phosphate synthase enzyme
MSVITRHIELSTKWNADILDITPAVSRTIRESPLMNGTVILFSPSATSGLTKIEYEPGCLSDIQRLFDEVADPQRHYVDNACWGDGTGHSHVGAARLGPSITVPFLDDRMTLGTWQQIIFVDFDNRSRKRRLVAQLIGE